MVTPEAPVRPAPQRRLSTSVVELSSGKISPWLSDATESVTNYGFLGGQWPIIRTERPGEQSTVRFYVASWSPIPPPRWEWVEYHQPRANWKYSVATPFIYWFEESRLMGIRFDAKQRRFSAPFLVRTPAAPPVEIRSTDDWSVRGPGITFARQEAKGSVWLMKLPN